MSCNDNNNNCCNNIIIDIVPTPPENITLDILNPPAVDIGINIQEFVTIWGNIIGDITKQRDLMALLSSTRSLDLTAMLQFLSANNVRLSAATITTDLSVGRDVYVDGTLYTKTTAITLVSYNQFVGDGSNNTFTVNHNFNSNYISVVVTDLTTNLVAYPAIQIPNLNSVVVDFSFVPPPSSYNVTVFGAVPTNKIAAFKIEQIENPRKNQLFVSLTGSDLNDGKDPIFPLRTVKKACEIAHNERVNGFNNRDVMYTIFVGTGDFYEENPIYVAPNTSIIGDNLRRSSIRPINKTFDIFWLDNSSYIWGFTFRDHLEPSAGAAFPILTNPLLTGIAFKNLLTPYVSPGVYKWRRPFITTSPYVQGSSSITSSLAMPLQTNVSRAFTTQPYPTAPLSIDGVNLSVNTIIGIIQNGLNNYSLQTYTVSPDVSAAVSIIQSVSAYIQDDTINHINSKYPYLDYNQTLCKRDVGYILSAICVDIQNGNNAQAIYNGQMYYSGNVLVFPQNQILPTVEAMNRIKTTTGNILNGILFDRSDIERTISTVTDILTYGLSGYKTYTYSPSPDALSAAQLIELNKNFIAKETLSFINRAYPTLTYNLSTCERDINYILSAVQVDIQNGNNNEGIRNGQHYYNGTSSYLPNGQIAPTVTSLNFLKWITKYVASNQVIPRYPAGAGMRVDGSHAEGFLRSMVLDSYTQFNEGGKGIYMLNNGYAQLVSIFTICCTQGILCETGGTCSISNSNSSFGLSGIVATGKSPVTVLTGTLVNNPFTSNSVIVSNVSGVNINPNSDYYVPGGLDTRKVAYTPYSGLIFTIGNDLTLYSIDNTNSPILSAGTDSTFNVFTTQNIFTNYEPGEIVRFYIRSTATASSHAFEYIGTGEVLARAVPALGGVTNIALEAVFADGGAVYFTSTNQAGDFRVGQEFTIVQETGTIEGDTFKRSILTLVTPLNLALE
jgi:hypothetical protein